MKQIVIIGGGGGLGSALVRQLLDRDYQVVVVGRTKPNDARIRKFYTVEVTHADWPSLYATIHQQTGTPVDAVMFVAGTAVFGNTALIPPDRASEVLALNFWACSAAAKSASEYWLQQQRPGKFLAVLSIVARHAVPFEAYYSASKAATARFLESLQLEYEHERLQFICAFPGMLKTPFRRQADWYGVEPAALDDGADVAKTAREIIDLLTGKRRTRVIGWRERAIDLADRFLPGIYDRLVVRRRVRKMLRLNAAAGEPRKSVKRATS